MEWKRRGMMGTMKTAISLCCALMLLFSLTGGWSAAAAEDAYPTPRIDPATGKVYDLQGKTVYLFDYWSSGASWRDWTPETDKDKALYRYRDWIETTYNCKVLEDRRGDWATCADELKSFYQNPDGRLCLFQIEPGKVTELIQAGACASWRESTSINLSESKWNSATTDFTTFQNRTFGVTAGKIAPAQCLFFNKRVLKEAGIDWNGIYDMQKAGTWTWDEFARVLNQIQRDTDNDGVNDVYGLLGNADDFYRVAVFSNGSSFAEVNDSGNLVSTLTDEKTLYALRWAKDLWRTYSAPQPENANWDWYKDVWKQGYVGFYSYQAYAGFDSSPEMGDMADPWGCVAFPIGPSGTKYVTISQGNVACIPNVYTQDQISKISLIYDLWTSPAPGGYSEDDYSRFEDLTDSRAIYETYAMLSDPNHSIADKLFLLGTPNDVIGPVLLWNMQTMDLDELIENTTAEWKEKMQQFNSIIKMVIGYDTLYLPADLRVIEPHAFDGIAAEVVVIPDGCQSIGSMAFANCPNLLRVLLPESLTNIAEDAFGAANPELVRK